MVPSSDRVVRRLTRVFETPIQTPQGAFVSVILGNVQRLVRGRSLPLSTTCSPGTVAANPTCGHPRRFYILHPKKQFLLVIIASRPQGRSGIAKHA